MPSCHILSAICLLCVLRSAVPSVFCCWYATSLLAALLLNLSGGSLFDHLVGMLVLSHAPVFVVDALISALALNLLWRMLPDMTRELCP